MKTICTAALLFSTLLSSAGILDTNLWSDHRQSTTLRADLCITQNNHFMWQKSPVPPRKLVIVVFDGKLAHGKMFSDEFGYKDPVDMAREYIFDMFISSHGHVRYNVIDCVIISNAPMRYIDSDNDTVPPYDPIKPSHYTNFTINAFYTRATSSFENLNHDSDNSTMDDHCITDFLHRTHMNIGGTLFSQATNGGIDQILFFGPHKAYQYESSMCGAHPLWINGATATISNSPHFVIIGGNTTRGIAEMIHNNYHRWENVAPNMYADRKDVGWKYQWSYSWQHAKPPYPYTELERQLLFPTKYNAWEQYSTIYAAITTNSNKKGQAMSGIGDCHYQVNTHPQKQGAYQYNHKNKVTSNYKYFRQPVLPLKKYGVVDPAIGPITHDVNCDTWAHEFQFTDEETDYQRSYINWSYAAMPHGPGQHLNKSAVHEGETPVYLNNNWWCYFAAHDEFLEPIRAMRRNNEKITAFPEPEWKYDTTEFTKMKWKEVGYPTSMHNVHVHITGEGTVDGTGSYLWGSSALLTASPTPRMWIENGVTNKNSAWHQVVVTENKTISVVY
jgi:hypothetical protein